MVRHIVSWNFKPELTPEERREAGALWTAAAVISSSTPRCLRRPTCPSIRTTPSTRRCSP